MSVSGRLEGLRVTRLDCEPSSGMSGRYESGDTAYRALLGHTATCAACRVGVACAVAVRLGRVWREVRRG